MTNIETPSGKNETTENFPVAKLVSKKFQPHVTAFYIFARAADDISDDPLLEPAEKAARLALFDKALMDDTDHTIPSVIPLRNSLKETGVTPQHARDLLRAFTQDATKLRYQNWEELIDYCNYSAAPVGRYLLDLHGESKSAWPANDALCNALQIINHIQDCGDDYRELDRCYIPMDIMESCGAVVTDLSQEQLTSAMRQTLDIMLAKMDPLLKLAHTFPGQLRDKHLKIDTAVICGVAERLSSILKERDPLCDNVKLSKGEKLYLLFKGFIKAHFV